MINRANVRSVIESNRQYLPSILVKVESVWEKGLHFKYKPIQSIQSYLMKYAEVILFPSKSLSYGGMVLCRNGDYYVHINTLQPKTYENFVWAHEFYHFEFEKERINNVNEPTFVNNPIDNENERLANLFASELLINSGVLKTLFLEKQEQNPDDSLEINIVRLMPDFELPYKTLVIKLAQDELISLDDAERIIEFNYRDFLPTDFDLSILKPSMAIRIDSLNNYINKIKKMDVMSPIDLESIESLKEKHLNQLDSIRHSY